MANFEVRNPEAEKYLRDIGRMLKDSLPEGFGFALLVCSLGEGGSMFYTSTIERDDMIKAMREFIKKFESN